ncbi:MAG: hypothetical protein MI976_16170, partial [Pseudomonadales bacterium]|nr:hypothetical protein [Pseudomonadales bacterium]
MNRKIQLGLALLASSVLSGCVIDINLVGEGKVTNLRGTTLCEEEKCQLRTATSPVQVNLQTEAAPGYTAIGLLNKDNYLYLSTESHYYYTYYGFQPVEIGHLYGGQGYQEPETITSTVNAAASDTEDGIVKPAVTPSYLQIYNDNVTAIFQPTDTIKDVHYGTGGACVEYLDDRVTCWGSNLEGEPESFSNLRLMDVSSSLACTVDDAGLRCWSHGSTRPTPTDFDNITKLEVAFSRGCVLHNTSGTNEVSCFTREGAPLDVPEFDNPTNMWVDDDLPRATCVEDNNGISCWGEGYYGQSEIPEEVTSVSDFAVAAHHTCAISESKVYCWGLDDAATEVPEGLINPTAIASTHNSTCVIANGEIVCWGRSISLPEYTGTPVDIELGLFSSCVDNGSELFCTSGNDTTASATYTSIENLHMGAHYGCYFDAGDFTCLGYYPTYFDDLENVSLYDTAWGSSERCIGNRDEVRCYYDRTVGNFYKTDFSIEPTAITMGVNFAC